MTAYAAFLRVYEPLAAFDGAERRRWEAYARVGKPPDPAEGIRLERAAALRALAGRPPALPVLEEHAYVTQVDGVTLVCPWRTRLRALEGLEEFLAELPEEMGRAFVAPPVAEAVEAELDAWRAANPALRNSQLSSTWQVPPRWFVLVDAEERELRLGDPSGPGAAPAGRLTARCLVYRTSMSRARRRLARALAVLRRHGDDGLGSGGVEDLGRWLEEFHPRSLVELDYGGLVHLLDDGELTEDQSARDIAGALAALDRGDAVAAAAAYGRVTARMKALQAVESAN